ncbi:MAG: hypothetical protein J3K34DRAFT_415634 [Monoraphidium minutum]|nr:MAG: hypothetical protein J3K34DRAFT_415634 [Monoraphidium minutum]
MKPAGGRRRKQRAAAGGAERKHRRRAPPRATAASTAAAAAAAHGVQRERRARKQERDRKPGCVRDQGARGPRRSHADRRARGHELCAVALVIQHQLLLAAAALEGVVPRVGRALLLLHARLAGLLSAWPRGPPESCSDAREDLDCQAHRALRHFVPHCCH